MVYRRIDFCGNLGKYLRRTRRSRCRHCAGNQYGSNAAAAGFGRDGQRQDFGFIRDDPQHDKPAFAHHMLYLFVR